MTAPAPVSHEQPPRPARPPGAGKGLTLRQRAEQLHAQLVQERASFMGHWSDINRVLFPRRGRFTITDVNKGDRRNKDIIDNTATIAGRTLASGMQSHITTPAREWFRLTTSNADLADQPAVKEWLHETTKDMFAILAKSNFYDTIHMAYGDAGVYGTSPFLVAEDDEDVIRCYPFAVGSYCLALDAKLRVAVFSREWQMNTRQLVEEYGYEQCSAAVRSAWDANRLEAWWPVVQVCMPNPEYNATLMLSRYKRFISITFEKANNEGDRLLRLSGYDEFPLFALRWDVTAEDVYATSCPGMDALGDVNQLQFAEKRALEGIDKQVRPPLVAPPSIASRPISQLPGGVTFDGEEAGPSRGLRPLFEAKPDLAGLENKQAQVRERINTAFFANLFLMLSYLDQIRQTGTPATATEIQERKEEKLLALGPVLNRLDKTVFGPFIDRLFQIMRRTGRLRPAPEELAGQVLEVEYISVLHAAQKAGGLAQIERFVQFVISYFEGTQDPSVLDTVDVDELVATYHDMAGVPPKLLRSEAAIAQLRDARAKSQAAAQQSEQLKTASTSASALAGADTGGKNALTDLLSAVNAGQ